MHMFNDKKEGAATRAVENQTAKIPSMVYLWAGMSALAASACMMACGKRHAGLMVGQWASPLLIMGLYNKLVKTEGHD